MQFRSLTVQFLFKMGQQVLQPFPNLRIKLIKGLILMEDNHRSGHAIQESLRRLFDIHGFIENSIDRQCLNWGNGVHVKHQLMDGIHSFFTDRVPPGSHVLDVGCGIGALAYALATHSDAEVTGMDVNEANVYFAAKHFQHQRLRFVVGNATSDFLEETFNIVVLSSVLEHIEARSDFLKKLLERYYPQRILIRVPGFERHYHAALKRRLGLFAYTDPDHKIEYTPDSFIAEMRNGGLEIAHMELRWGDIWAECKPQN